MLLARPSAHSLEPRLASSASLGAAPSGVRRSGLCPAPVQAFAPSGATRLGPPPRRARLGRASACMCCSVAPATIVGMFRRAVFLTRSPGRVLGGRLRLPPPFPALIGAGPDCMLLVRFLKGPLRGFIDSISACPRLLIGPFQGPQGRLRDPGCDPELGIVTGTSRTAPSRIRDYHSRIGVPDSTSNV